MVRCVSPLAGAAGKTPIVRLIFPKLSLVVLIGPSGSGKSTFARKHFLPSEMLSSDSCRALVSRVGQAPACLPKRCIPSVTEFVPRDGAESV